jgi:hypothetical protein
MPSFSWSNLLELMQNQEFLKRSFNILQEEKPLFRMFQKDKKLLIDQNPLK